MYESAWNAGDPGSSLCPEDPLEEDMAAYSSILAWRMSWTEEPGGLQFVGSQRVRRDWARVHRRRKRGAGIQTLAITPHHLINNHCVYKSFSDSPHNNARYYYGQDLGLSFLVPVPSSASISWRQTNSFLPFPSQWNWGRIYGANPQLCTCLFNYWRKACMDEEVISKRSNLSFTSFSCWCLMTKSGF